MTWELLPASRLVEFVAEWDALNRLGGDSPMLAADMVLAALRFFGDGEEFPGFATDGLRRFAALPALVEHAFGGASPMRRVEIGGKATDANRPIVADSSTNHQLRYLRSGSLVPCAT